ncbi:hypothetical protein, partial [Acinetobacter nosocomialis]|uniref:hypothetical protein n=1 Tax=Acinetobacter nosocomialis TaxID=106654 RepID=UPI001C06A6D3
HCLTDLIRRFAGVLHGVVARSACTICNIDRSGRGVHPGVLDLRAGVRQVVHEAARLPAGQRAADGRCIPAWGEFCYRPGRNSRQQSLIVVVPG